MINNFLYVLFQCIFAIMVGFMISVILGRFTLYYLKFKNWLIYHHWKELHYKATIKNIKERTKESKLLERYCMFNKNKFKTKK